MHHIFILDRGGSSSLKKELTFSMHNFSNPTSSSHLIFWIPFCKKVPWTNILGWKSCLLHDLTQSYAMRRSYCGALYFAAGVSCQRGWGLLSNTGWLKAASKQKTGCRVTIDINPCGGINGSRCVLFIRRRRGKQTTSPFPRANFLLSGRANEHNLLCLLIDLQI